MKSTSGWKKRLLGTILANFTAVYRKYKWKCYDKST